MREQLAGELSNTSSLTPAERVPDTCSWKIRPLQTDHNSHSPCRWLRERRCCNRSMHSRENTCKYALHGLVEDLLVLG